ncbi:MAG TPA: rhomboid family intramembrane serine protease [Streptosporangiaceae bacterium]|nr:rhomboid family intramembrane serine protease [Streptosporangiaceae bacterium]
MSDKAAVPASGKQQAPSTWRGWTLESGDPAALLAKARSALFVMVVVLAAIWIIQIANWATGYSLARGYGIRPRDVGSLPYLLTAPFVHFSWTHIEGNSGPLFIFGFLAAYRGIGKFAAVTAVVVLTSGFAAWLFGSPHSVGAGASGVVFGYFGYIIVRGLFDRHAIDLLVGLVMALCFAYQFTVLLPHQGIGWQAHVGGLVGGVASGWLFRERRGTRRAGRGPSKGADAPETTSQSAAVWSASLAAIDAPAKAGQSGKDTGKKGKPAAVDPSNPRAALYKELDDQGL